MGHTFFILFMDATFYGPSGYKDVLTPKAPAASTRRPGWTRAWSRTAMGPRRQVGPQWGTYHFNTSGQLSSDVDRNNNTVTYNYTSGHLSSIQDTRGRTLTVTTNSSGQITQLQDSDGRKWVYCYNSAGDLTSYTDANGKTTYYSYTGTHLLSQVTDPAGNVTQFTYGSGGQVATVLLRAPAASGGAAEYDEVQLQPLALEPVPSGTYGETTVTDPNGHATIYCFDSSGRQTLSQNADGHSASESYGTDNLPATTTSAGQQTAGVNTSLSYNGEQLADRGHDQHRRATARSRPSSTTTRARGTRIRTRTTSPPRSSTPRGTARTTNTTAPATCCQ